MKAVMAANKVTNDFNIKQQFQYVLKSADFGGQLIIYSIELIYLGSLSSYTRPDIFNY
jgi:hypothetical protein